jgi:hypothetical protein
MRRILFLAHQLVEVRSVRQDERSLELLDREFERYEDVRKALCTFGRVMREQTSGTFRRVSTPPNGIRRESSDARDRVLIENPRDHASTVEVTAQQRKDVIHVREAFLKAIRECDAVVAMTELESDTRGSLIEHAVAAGKPVLLLRRETNYIAPLHPMYLHREGITCSTYRDERELLSLLSRFFQRIPHSQSHTG